MAAHAHSITTKEMAHGIATDSKNGLGTFIKDEMMTLKVQNLPRPTKTMVVDGQGVETASTDKIDVAIFEKEIDNCVGMGTKLKLARREAFERIWGQCSESVKAEVESDPRHETAAKGNGVVALLKLI